MTISSMAEPAMMLSIFTVSLTVGSTNLSNITGTLLNYKSLNPSLLLAFAALVIVIIAETGRIPVDNPFTHLELTMIHEGMILEFFRALSGPDRMGIFHEAAVVIDYPGEYLFTLGDCYWLYFPRTDYFFCIISC